VFAIVAYIVGLVVKILVGFGPDHVAARSPGTGLVQAFVQVPVLLFPITGSHFDWLSGV
jgi:hypothetical protein